MSNARVVVTQLGPRCRACQGPIGWGRRFRFHGPARYLGYTLVLGALAAAAYTAWRYSTADWTAAAIIRQTLDKQASLLDGMGVPPAMVDRFRDDGRLTHLERDSLRDQHRQWVVIAEGAVAVTRVTAANEAEVARRNAIGHGLPVGVAALIGFVLISRRRLRACNDCGVAA